MADERRDRVGDCTCVSLDSTLPKAKNRPAVLAKRACLPPIARDVCLKLGRPIWRVVPTSQAFKTFPKVFAVPEVAITENHDARRPKDEVGAPRQVVGGQRIP